MKTPISDAAEKRSAHPQFIFIEDARTLETAAQGLRDALDVAGLRCPQVHHCANDQHGPQVDCPVELRISKALARFDALKEGKQQP